MIERSSAVKRDYKRVKATPRYRKTPENNYDHALSNNWSGYRKCHLKPDPSTLRLARLGSHSELIG